MPVPNKDDRGTSEQEATGTLDEQDQAFSDAFDTASVEPAGVDDKGEKTDQPAGDLPEKKDSAEPAAVDSSPPASSSASSPQDTGSYEQQYKTLQGIHRHDRETWESERTQLLAKITEMEKGGGTQTVTQDKKSIEDAGKLLDELKDSLSDEERAQLDEYKQEFDIVSKMEGLQRKVEMAKLRKDLVGMLEEIKGQLQPVQAFVSQSAEDRDVADRNAHFSAIEEKHADYAKYRDDGSLMNWIDSLPVHRRQGYKDICKSGTVEEVISLYDEFKSDNNIPIEGNNDSPPNVVKLDKERRKDALRSPTGRKSAVNPTHTPATSFEDSFDEAINEQGG